MTLQLDLSPRAVGDLEDIWRFTAENWGRGKADAYTGAIDAAMRGLLVNPFATRERSEVTPPVRLRRCGSHFVIFRVVENRVSVLRIIHVKANWRAVLS